MQLSQSDKKVLLNALNRRGCRRGVVLESSLEKRRCFNAAKKLAKAGLIENVTIEYQYSNGRPDTLFGRVWIEGHAWSDFKGELTSEGLKLAESLQN
ncbi:hypothetical protein [Pseudoalteromonas luteoviolacea]|uniref:hypothetical protein n=1 Tax=Pseudoalteromonas luteoviolacea TaxID=43657 RepID=UPI001B36B5C7|nr:hypothetical protein [Pseudoalteromonas luteoviolacea]MBQ4839797.1 hypothetical protein [Pseudoalteromonas luteoviolacea]